MGVAATRCGTTQRLNLKPRSRTFCFDMTPAKIPALIRLAAVLALWPTILPLLAADATPAQPNPQAQPPGARRSRGGPITTEDQAAIAKLGELPVWKPGAG